MALLKFNDGSGANAGERKGIASGMFLGKAIHDLAAGMKALAEPGKQMMNNMMDAVKQAPQKLAYQAKMAFANADEGFGSTFSKQKAAQRVAPARKGPGMAPT